MFRVLPYPPLSSRGEIPAPGGALKNGFYEKIPLARLVTVALQPAQQPPIHRSGNPRKRPSGERAPSRAGYNNADRFSSPERGIAARDIFNTALLARHTVQPTRAAAGMSSGGGVSLVVHWDIPTRAEEGS
jgi:hypothetical protein